jgi:hypothetical protein
VSATRVTSWSRLHGGAEIDSGRPQGSATFSMAQLGRHFSSWATGQFPAAPGGGGSLLVIQTER